MERLRARFTSIDGLMVKFTWHGDRFRRQVRQDVAERLRQAGAAGVQLACELAPVDTGRLRSSIHAELDATSLTLAIVADAPEAIFVELGTSRTPARPFLRPALAAMARFFSGSGGQDGATARPSAHAPSARGGRKRGARLRLRKRRGV